MNATRLYYLTFGQNWVFCWFGKLKVKTHQDLVQVWSQSSFNFLKEIRHLKTLKKKKKKKKEIWTKNGISCKMTKMQIQLSCIHTTDCYNHLKRLKDR